MKLYLLFPFVSSILYVVAVLFLKRSAELNVGVWRTSFVSNVAASLMFLSLWPMGGAEIDWSKLWQPILVATLFMAGQTFTLLALRVGDVSVATPTMGVKTILVAWLSLLLLPVTIPWQLWVSAVLTFLAIGLLNAKEKNATEGENKAVGRTILLALIAAAAYSLFDVLVQKWSPAWGTGRFLPIMFICCAILSCGFIPFFREPLRAIPKAAWPWLGFGAFFLGLQALSLVSALSRFGDATAMNVLYSARGLWSVVAVWWIGHWFQNKEQHLEKRVLRLRLIGAAMMTIAIVITVLA